MTIYVTHILLPWRCNEHNGASNYRRLDGLLNNLFRRNSKKTLKLHVTGICEGYSLVTSEFPSQRVSYAENVSIWWCHHHQYDVLAQKYMTLIEILLSYRIQPICQY